MMRSGSINKMTTVYFFNSRVSAVGVDIIIFYLGKAYTTRYGNCEQKTNNNFHFQIS